VKHGPTDVCLVSLPHPALAWFELAQSPAHCARILGGLDLYPPSQYPYSFPPAFNKGRGVFAADWGDTA
jgi:hypothetical protein